MEKKKIFNIISSVKCPISVMPWLYEGVKCNRNAADRRDRMKAAVYRVCLCAQIQVNASLDDILVHGRLNLPKSYPGCEDLEWLESVTGFESATVHSI